MKHIEGKNGRTLALLTLATLLSGNGSGPKTSLPNVGIVDAGSRNTNTYVAPHITLANTPLRVGACEYTTSIAPTQFECKASDGNLYLVPQILGLSQERVTVADGVTAVKYVANSGNSYGLKAGEYAGMYDPNVYFVNSKGETIHSGGFALVPKVVNSLPRADKNSTPIPLDISTMRDLNHLNMRTTIFTQTDQDGFTRTYVRTTRESTAITRPSGDIANVDASGTIVLTPDSDHTNNLRRSGADSSLVIRIFNNQPSQSPEQSTATIEAGDIITTSGGDAGGMISLAESNTNTTTPATILQINGVPVFLI